MTDDEEVIYVTRYSLRDHFAGCALQGLLTTFQDDQRDVDGLNPAVYARWCYEMADAMLEARKK